MTPEPATGLANPYVTAIGQEPPRPRRRTTVLRMLSGVLVASSLSAGAVGVGVANAGPTPADPGAYTVAALCADTRAVGTGGRAPTSTNQTFVDGSGHRVHLGINAAVRGLECRAGELDRTDPTTRAYLADVRTVLGALRRCAGEPLKYDRADDAIDPEYTYYNYAQRIARGDQGGDRWFSCLSRTGTTDQQINGGPGSISQLLLVCRDRPATPYPDYIGCKQSMDEQRAASRAAEASSRAAASEWIVRGGGGWGYDDGSGVAPSGGDIKDLLGVNLPPFRGYLPPNFNQDAPGGVN